VKTWPVCLLVEVRREAGGEGPEWPRGRRRVERLLYKGLCPTHGDRKPSLSVSEGDDGRVLIKCFAGCATEEVVAALGLEMKDLFETPNGHRKKVSFNPPENECNRATVQPEELRRD
jgi:hypothetical protein